MRGNVRYAERHSRGRTTAVARIADGTERLVSRTSRRKPKRYSRRACRSGHAPSGGSHGLCKEKREQLVPRRQGRSAAHLHIRNPADAKLALICLWVSRLRPVRRSLLKSLLIRLGLRLLGRVGCLASFALPALEVIVCLSWRVGCSKEIGPGESRVGGVRCSGTTPTPILGVLLGRWLERLDHASISELKPCIYTRSRHALPCYGPAAGAADRAKRGLRGGCHRAPGGWCSAILWLRGRGCPPAIPPSCSQRSPRSLRRAGKPDRSSKISYRKCPFASKNEQQSSYEGSSTKCSRSPSRIMRLAGNPPGSIRPIPFAHSTLDRMAFLAFDPLVSHQPTYCV
jgi:hypothetical protein